MALRDNNFFVFEPFNEENCVMHLSHLDQLRTSFSYCVSGHPSSCFLFRTHNISETGVSLCLQVGPTQLALSIDLVPVSRHHLKTETESSLRNGVRLK
jgi:hypothetical protein